MTATRLHLVRHGRVHARWSGRLYGDLDVELSDEGREQARRAAERLAGRPLDAALSSDLERARFGAEAIAAGRELEPRRVPALREISRGEWAGRRIDELALEQPGALDAWFEAPEHTRPPGGESVADLRARVLPALGAIAAEHPGGELAIVVHGWVIRSTLGWILGLPSTALTRLHVPPASIATVDWDPELEVGPEIAAEPPSGPQRGWPYLVGVQVDRVAPDGRGWYRSPANANS